MTEQKHKNKDTTADSMLRALKAVRKMKSKIKELESARSEPIALVGMSCRFPGKSDTPDAFWQMLKQGRDAIAEMPSERWPVDSWFDPDPDVPGKMYTRYGAFIDAVDQFDAEFFGLSPREVAKMDPQHRLLLYTSWEALESAALPPLGLRGTATGVFIGIGKNDYAHLQPTFTRGHYHKIEAYDVTGNGFSFAAGRLSHYFGFQGPSMALDTACSSSLAALHLACLSLRNEECHMALVGGVHLILSPLSTVMLSRMKAISPDGTSKTFDDKADGFGRGEGCAVVLLKRYTTAVKDRDPILAVIRGSAMNQDGRASGMTVPNGPSQESVIRKALENAKVSPKEVDYIETHGTGTSLGDPIEVGALSKVYASERSMQDPLIIGSVKTNIGHLEAAAGLAGLIKVVLALQHENIPPHLHFSQPNRNISWDELPIVVATETMPWPKRKRSRFAGLSSFGISGTNVHMIIEEAPAPKHYGEKNKAHMPQYLFTLAARSQKALSDLARRFEAYLADFPHLAPEAICYTMNTGRSHFDHRLAIIADSTIGIRENLAVFRSEKTSDDLLAGCCSNSPESVIAMLIPGEHQTLRGMQRLLFDSQPTFREDVRHCWRILGAHKKLPPIETLFIPGDNDVLKSPALFILTYALSRMWLSWGISPAFIMGEGAGVLAAAHIAGLISLEQGLRLTVEWDRIIELPAAMQFQAINECWKEITFAPPHIGLVSAATGELVGDEHAIKRVFSDLDSKPSGFIKGMKLLQEQGCNVFVGIGPEMIRQGKQILQGKVQWIPGYGGVNSGERSFLHSVAELYIGGFLPDWNAAAGTPTPTRLSLPTYQFQGQRYWVEESTDSAQPISNQELNTEHFSLGRRIGSPLIKEILYEKQYSIQALPYLDHHKVFGRIVVAGASHLAMFLEVAIAEYGDAKVILEDLHFLQGLVIRENKTIQVQVVLSPESEDSTFCRLISFTGNSAKNMESWVENATARIIQEPTISEDVELIDCEKILGRCREKIEGSIFYQSITRRRFEFGTSFRRIEYVHKGEDEALGHLIQLKKSNFNGNFKLHPGLIDSCLQMVGALFQNDSNDTYVAYALERFQLHRTPQSEHLWCHAKVRNDRINSEKQVTCDLHLFETDGRPVASMHGFTIKQASQKVLLESLQKESNGSLYKIVWRPAELETAVSKGLDEEEAGRWLIFEDSAGHGKRLTHLLTKAGERVVRISAGKTFRRIDDAQYEIRPTCSQDYHKVLTECLSQDTKCCKGIVYLWSLNDYSMKTIGAMDSTQVLAIQELGCLGVMQLAKGMGINTSNGTIPRLWVATVGAQPVGNTPFPKVSPIHAPLWGLGRVIATELPQLQCTCVDLERTYNDLDMQLLFQELLVGNREDQVAYRDGQRYVARLMPIDSTTGIVKKKLSAETQYIITGGFGALGILTAKRLVDCGARHLMLVGRRGISNSRIQEQIRALENQGVHITAVSADISDIKDMERLKAMVYASQKELRGVVHAAGVLDDALLSHQNRKTFLDVMAPKVAGTWNLHCMTRDLHLDFFVCFSSASSLLGAPGQSNYAAANAFMDALVHYRRSLGLTGISINWGPWDNIGMAAKVNDSDKVRWSAVGVGTFSASDGMDLFERLLCSESSQVAAIKLDLLKISRSRFYTAATMLLKDLKLPVTAGGQTQNDFISNLESIAPEQREDMIMQHIRQQIAEVLNLESAHHIKMSQKLFDFGLDSLMAVELRNRLQQSTGVPLSSTLVFDYPTPYALSAYLLRTLIPTHEEEISRPEAEVVGEADSDLEMLFEKLETMTDVQIAQVMKKK